MIEKSNVTAVHKSCCRYDPSRFRLVSVVPILAKILEKLVASQLSINFYFEQI